MYVCVLLFLFFLFFFSPHQPDVKHWRQLVFTNTNMTDKHAHTRRHADTGSQKADRPSAGTLASVLFQLGSYQCVWWVVIRRYNTSGSWPANHNGGSITATAPLPSHSQQPMCPWNGEWEWSGKITSPAHSNDEFGQPCPHSVWSHVLLIGFLIDWIPHGVIFLCQACMTFLSNICKSRNLVYFTQKL